MTYTKNLKGIVLYDFKTDTDTQKIETGGKEIGDETALEIYAVTSDRGNKQGYRHGDTNGYSCLFFFK